MASKAAKAAYLRMHKLADRATPAVQRDVLRALERLQESIPAQRIERVLRSGDAFALHDLTASLPIRLRTALAKLARVVAQAYALETSVVAVVRMSLDLTEPAVVRAARAHAAELVTAVTQQTRASIRLVVARSVVQGIPPRELARMVRPMIGLTPAQGRAVLNRLARLVAMGFSRGEAALRAGAYARKLLRQRARTIARTETISAATRGQLAAWQQARVDGLVLPGARVTWTTTPDDRLCPYCASMQGATVPLGVDFETPLGPRRGPPLHPNCRCAIGLLAVREQSRRAA